MKTKLFSVLTLTGFLLLICPTVVSAQFDEEWEDASDNPVLSWGEPDEWDDDLVWHPAVIKDGDTLRMYYTGGNERLLEDPLTKIGYAWSLDGIEWTKYHSNPVLLPNFGWAINGCTVIKDEDTYKMWYGESDARGAPAVRIGYATSEDAVHWTRKSSSVLEVGPIDDWDEGFINQQTVIKDGDVYKMWYWAMSKDFPFVPSLPRSGMATSPDGINWTKYDDPATTEAPFASSDPVLDVGAEIMWDDHRAICPMVRKKEGGFEMWYSGASFPLPERIGYAHSNDGIHWTRHPDPVYDSPSWGNTNYGGTVLAFDNKYHLWYGLMNSTGSQNEGRCQIGYAIAPNPDGIASQSMVANIQLYPNPFSNSTTISFELQHSSTVQITIYNQLGEQVEVIQLDQSHGKQQLVWNAEVLPAGVYFCVLKTETGTQTTKMIKMKR